MASEGVGGAATSFEVCVHCDARAAPLLVPGSRESYAQLLFQSLRLPVGGPTVGAALLIWALVEVTLRFSGGVSALSFVTLTSVLWFLFFAVLQAAARGADLVGQGGEVGLGQDVLLPALRAVGITLCVALGVWLLELRGDAVHGVYVDLRAWAVVTGVAVVGPGVLIALALGERSRSALSLWRLASLWRALGRDMLLLCALSQAGGALLLLWLGAAGAGSANGIRLLPMLLLILSLGALLFGARLLGLVMAARAPALGLPLRADQLIPALPDARPRGVRQRREPIPWQRPRAESLVLEESSAPLELEGIAAVDPLDQAVAAFALQPDPVASVLPVADLISIGQRAAARARLDQAVRALKLAASTRPEDPEAPRACVILARLYAERLANEEAAQKLYRFVADRHPDTPAGRFAQEQLQARSAPPSPGERAPGPARR